jgi:penicillin-binding protein 1C
MNTTRIIAFSSLVCSSFLFVFWAWSFLFPIPNAYVSQEYGQRFTDRNGQVLSFSVSSQDKYLLEAVDFADMPLSFVLAVLALEDDNFFAHGAIDAPAVFRALFQNVIAGEIVSGASTITLQLAKKMLGNTNRTLANKIREAVLAFRIEKQFSKEEIFGMWTSRAPFGGNIVGLSAASEFYFRKQPQYLSLAQSAYLASIPKNPSLYSPKNNPELLEKRKEYALLKMFQHDFITKEEFQTALHEKITPVFSAPSIKAPHLVLYLSQQLADVSSLALALEIGLQQKVESIIDRYMVYLDGHNANNAAAMVIENSTGAVRAYVGNTDFFSSESDGQVDMLRSFRQVGSTLKPFVYYLAFRDLFWGPQTIVLDEPIGFDTSIGTTFAPKNFDLDYRGKITIREALAQSRNIPAVSTLAQVGEKKFKEFLQSLGVDFLLPQDDIGLSSVLGASEMQLLDLARLYVLLAREGQDFFFCFVGVCPQQHGNQILQRNLVLEITDILSDNTARIDAFGEDSPLANGFPVAAKTGTSRNFRDNYTVGYTPEYTVLVWVGNADGSPMREVSGISGTGPIFQDIINILPKSASDFSSPIPRDTSSNSGFSVLRILQPLPNAQYSLDPSRSIEDQKIRFQSSANAEFFVDGELVGSGKEVLWMPKTGEHLLRVVSDSESESVQFFVEGGE